MTNYIVQVIQTAEKVTSIQSPKGIVSTNSVVTVVTQGVQGPRGPSGSGGGISWNYVSIDSAVVSSYDVDFSTDGYITVDTSTNPVVINLPVSTNINKGAGVFVARQGGFAVTTQVLGLAQNIDSDPTDVLDDEQVQLYVSTGSGYKLS